MEKSARKISWFLCCGLAIAVAVSACASRKRGCPSNGANVGAERVLSEKGLKKSKFKIKNMN